MFCVCFRQLWPLTLMLCQTTLYVCMSALTTQRILQTIWWWMTPTLAVYLCLPFLLVSNRQRLKMCVLSTKVSHSLTSYKILIMELIRCRPVFLLFTLLTVSRLRICRLVVGVWKYGVARLVHYCRRTRRPWRNGFLPTLPMWAATTSVTTLGRLPLLCYANIFSFLCSVGCVCRAAAVWLFALNFSFFFSSIPFFKCICLFSATLHRPLSCCLCFNATSSSSSTRLWSFTNLNTSCYINAVLQILFALDDFCSEAEALVENQSVRFIGSFPSAFREFAELSFVRRRGNVDDVNECHR